MTQETTGDDWWNSLPPFGTYQTARRDNWAWYCKLCQSLRSDLTQEHANELLDQHTRSPEHRVLAGGSDERNGDAPADQG